MTSDPKGEWVAVARWLGGKVLAVGPGTRTVINLLDAGVRPAHVDASEWEAMVAARRATALTSICQAVRPEQGLSPGEQVVIDMVCERISSGQVPARLRDVVEYLRRRPPELIDQVGEEAHRQVRLMLARPRQDVGQDQPPLGVGVADLDGQALAAVQDVARPEGVGRHRVLDRRDQHHQPHRQTGLHNQAAQGQGVGGAEAGVQDGGVF